MDSRWRTLIERAMWWEATWRALELRLLRRLAAHVELHQGQRLVWDDGPFGEQLLRLQYRLAWWAHKAHFRADVAGLRARELRRLHAAAEVAAHG